MNSCVYIQNCSNVLPYVVPYSYQVTYVCDLIYKASQKYAVVVYTNKHFSLNV